MYIIRYKPDGSIVKIINSKSTSLNEEDAFIRDQVVSNGTYTTPENDLCYDGSLFVNNEMITQNKNFDKINISSYRILHPDSPDRTLFDITQVILE